MLIDRPIGLGQPPPHSVLFEHGRQVPQLIGGERGRTRLWDNAVNG
ncbi:hypothetical protein ACQP0U_20975 [Micromonospora sp. CA-269861]